MSTHPRLDEATRDALADLADRVRPINLSDRALAGARRRYRYALAGGTAAAVAAVALLGGTLLAVSPNTGGTVRTTATRVPTVAAPSGNPQITPSLGQGEVDPPAELVTTAGFDVASWPSGGSPITPSVVYDRAHHEYVSLPYDQAIPAPTGTLVVVTGQQPPYPVSLLDTATTTTTPLHVDGYEPRDARWSPDGSKLLFRVDDKGNNDTQYGFAVVDVATRQSHTVWLHEAQYDSSDVQFNWYPDGTKVALSIADRAHSSEATGDAVLYLQLFDLTGRPAGTVPAKTWAPAAHAWSPDRRYLVAVDAYPTDRLTGAMMVMVDTRTGKVAARLPDAQDAWWLDDTHLVVNTSPPDAASTLDELDVSKLAGQQTAHYDRSFRLPVVSWNAGMVLYPHRS
jgi:hypothetical protein